MEHSALTVNPYKLGLDKTAADFAALTPLSFPPRTAGFNHASGATP